LHSVPADLQADWCFGVAMSKYLNVTKRHMIENEQVAVAHPEEQQPLRGYRDGIRRPLVRHVVFDEIRRSGQERKKSLAVGET
jgi:hypothetical protein